MKKKNLIDIADFKNYLNSAKRRVITLVEEPSKEYLSMVYSITLISTDSGKKLTIVVDWECYFCDLGGDTGAQEFYEFGNFKELSLFLNQCKIKIDGINLRPKDPSWIEQYAKVQKLRNSEMYNIYSDSWENFKIDWSTGKLFLKGMQPTSTRKQGW